MWLFFFGFLLVFAEFPITFPLTGGTVDLLPAFLGFALLFLGAKKMSMENLHFRRIRIAALPAFAVSAVHFVIAILHLDLAFFSYDVAELILLILTVAAKLYIAYEFTEAVKKIERSHYKKFGADKLASAWIILCMTSLLGFLVAVLPSIALPQLVVHLLAVVWFEASVFGVARTLKKQ